MSVSTFVVTWVLHSTVLGLIALALPVLFRLRDPKALVSWWGGTAGIVVLLPLVPLLLPGRTSHATGVATFVEQTTVAIGPALAAPPAFSPAAWLAGLWVLGVAARLGWLIAGHRRLRRLAARGVPVNADAALDQARALAPSAVLPHLDPAGVSVVAVANAGPCAFGWSDACVLVPVALAERPDRERLAVYVHELAHVARGDLLRGYGNEAWRLAWWWQPAVWLALAQLRLAREHEIDALVVSRTGGARAYVEALLWCSTLQPAGAPGMPVGSRRHALVRRVSLMCEGRPMSRTRRWITAAAMVLSFGAVAGVMGTLAPLRAAQLGARSSVVLDAGPLERVAVRPTLDAPVPRRVFGVEADWPDASTAYRFRTHVVINASGAVAEARVVGPPFTSAGTESTAAQLAAARAAALDAVRQWQFESPLRSPMLLVTDVIVGKSARATELFRSVTLSAAGAPPVRDALRVGGNIKPPKKVLDVKPEYPQVAMDGKVQGVVIIEATIDTAGGVSETRVLRSIPLLDQAALTAVRGWQYEPTWLNGEAVPVIMVVTVNFTLQ